MKKGISIVIILVAVIFTYTWIKNKENIEKISQIKESLIKNHEQLKSIDGDIQNLNNIYTQSWSLETDNNTTRLEAIEGSYSSIYNNIDMIIKNLSNIGSTPYNSELDTISMALNDTKDELTNKINIVTEAMKEETNEAQRLINQTNTLLTVKSFLEEDYTNITNTVYNFNKLTNTLNSKLNINDSSNVQVTTLTESMVFPYTIMSKEGIEDIKYIKQELSSERDSVSNNLDSLIEISENGNIKALKGSIDTNKDNIDRITLFIQNELPVETSIGNEYKNEISNAYKHFKSKIESQTTLLDDVDKVMDLLEADDKTLSMENTISQYSLLCDYLEKSNLEFLYASHDYTTKNHDENIVSKIIDSCNKIEDAFTYISDYSIDQFYSLIQNESNSTISYIDKNLDTIQNQDIKDITINIKDGLDLLRSACDIAFEYDLEYDNDIANDIVTSLKSGMNKIKSAQKELKELQKTTF